MKYVDKTILTASKSATRILINKAIELRHKLKGTRFYCNALAGNSAYNISINSDASVSCTCKDENGEGRLGSLAGNSFEEIWFGKVAESFRQSLYNGRVPVTHCFFCRELRVVKTADQIPKAKLPSVGIMIENTSICNLSCTSCLRDALYQQRRNVIAPFHMDKAARIARDLNLKIINFLKLGEPFASPRVLEEVETLRRHNPNAIIICSTNGMLLRGTLKQEAALKMDFIYFSIDGINTEMCQKYQKGQIFDVAFDNLAELVRLRKSMLPVLVWKIVIFRWNDKREYIEQAIEMARNASVDYIMLDVASLPYSGMSLRARFGSYLHNVGRRSCFGRMIRIAATDEQDKWLLDLEGMYS